MRILDANRSLYKRTFSDEDFCPFCDEKEILECEDLYGRYWRILVNTFPYMDGNVMMVTSTHKENTADLGKNEWEEFGSILEKTKDVLGKVFKTDSFNIALNLGADSGASIRHIHWQIVPRKQKNITALNTFADLYVVSVTPEETKRLIEEAIRNTSV